MAKTDNVIDILQSGLRAEYFRQKAIAANVANLKTPGYKTVDVRFEEQLNKALQKPGEFNAGSVEPEFFCPGNTSVNASGNDVSLEQQVGEMVQNSLKYTTYVRLLNKKYSQIDQAINIR